MTNGMLQLMRSMSVIEKERESEKIKETGYEYVEGKEQRQLCMDVDVEPRPQGADPRSVIS